MPTESQIAELPTLVDSKSSGSERRLEPLSHALPGGYGRSTFIVGKRQTPRAVRGEGAFVFAEDGRKLLDLNGNYTTLVVGHCHREVNAALSRALENGSSFGIPNFYESALAESIVQRIDGADQVRFSNSGSEAVMTAIRAARGVTGKFSVIGVESSFHGTSDIALTIRHGVHARGVSNSARNEVYTVPINDLASFERALEVVNDDLAAVVVDLMPNQAGLVPAEGKFIRALREACDQRGAYLIFDEIVSFRSYVGGLQSQYEVTPDLTTLGKIIGGGLPIGAVAGSTVAMEPLNPFSNRPVASMGTFSGNPLSMSAGLACLKNFDEDEIARLNSLGERLRQGLSASLPAGWSVKGNSSLAKVVPDKSSTDVLESLWWQCWDRGVLIMPTGLMALSTPMTETDIQSATDVISEACSSILLD